MITRTLISTPVSLKEALDTYHPLQTWTAEEKIYHAIHPTLPPQLFTLEETLTRDFSYQETVWEDDDGNFLEDSFDQSCFSGVIVESNGAALQYYNSGSDKTIFIAGQGQRKVWDGYELPWENPWYVSEPWDRFIPEQGYETGDTWDSLLREAVTVWKIEIPYCLVYNGQSIIGNPIYTWGPYIEWENMEIMEYRLCRKPKEG